MVLALAVVKPLQLWIRSGSGQFDLRATISPRNNLNDPDQIQGPATIEIFRKGTTHRLQTLRLANIELFPRQIVYRGALGKPSPSPYDDDYTFVFDDFNFDGVQDLAICSGNNSGYGLPSYVVYLYSKRLRKFLIAKELCKLAQEHLGLFSVDRKNHTLLVFDKDGAAWHKTTIYKMQGTVPRKIETVTDSISGSVETITQEKRSGGRWIRQTKRLPFKP
jgi:hypothetical protein